MLSEYQYIQLYVYFFNFLSVLCIFQCKNDSQFLTGGTMATVEDYNCRQSQVDPIGWVQAKWKALENEADK